MGDSKSNEIKKKQELLEKFISQLKDPYHKRLIGAYDINDPVSSMELELQAILMELFSDED